MPGGWAPAWLSMVAGQRARLPHIRDVDEAGFVAPRRARDAQLPLPDLMLAALQVNLRGGRLPPIEANGRSYLKIPLNAF